MISAFPYIGGKTRLARWVIRHLPPHTAYVEPFGGSAAVLLNKPRSDVEIFNDLDSDVVTFFRVARERPEELAEWCRYVPFSEQLHDEWADEFFAGERPNDEIEHAGKWLFLRYSQYAGKVSRKSGFKRESPHDDKGSRNARNWVNAPERIEEVADRFRGVSVVNEDFAAVVERYDSPETVFYLDPPYWEKEHFYREQADHATLEETLRGIEGFALVSYTDLPPGLYDDPEWTVVERTATHSAAGNGKTATERLVLNFEPSTDREFTQHRLTDLSTHGQARTDGGGA
ncbi:DNA adenine methylase [Natrarchaeobaculum aegyptiacum]|uniref:site-specific DNA-methyltransferase (adenine-specific) n=1 Tax=Natrarchaeobaculum aegyptiacum TaxID=745377 RepID=A0A2Z2I2T8_9EURY|nr:DNA adenine methylase [Natrarchaeobaculum aegyptiacum]ARS91398.1 adenine methyltransferase [Natrarchaeobaculum aegyptiacum]